MNDCKNQKIKNEEEKWFTFLFGDLHNTSYYGFGAKRVSLHLKNSISEKVPMSGYGFKDQKGVLYLGVRMWLDQGNYVKQYIYDKNYPIMMQLNNIVQEFDFEYKNKL